MQQLALSPYFHPTTVVLVDDNESFLTGVALEMPPSIAFRGFTTPEEALDFLNRPSELAPLADRCFTYRRSADSEALIHLDLGVIEQEINHLERFSRISVVLVDYAMPSMDGLEFCRLMEDPHARRAMLTGVADEKQAVDAFNAGLIHRFIPKQQTSAIDALLAFVAELEREYFNHHLARLRTTLALDPPSFLVDGALAVHVHRIIQQEHIVEYYLATDPPGFLMLRSDGSVIRLVLMDQASQRHQIELVRRYDAPPDIRRGIESGSLVGLFGGESPADYFGEEAFPWGEHVVTGQPVPGADGWLQGLVRNAATDIDFDPAASSYDTYLARLSAR